MDRVIRTIGVLFAAGNLFALTLLIVPAPWIPNPVFRAVGYLGLRPHALALLFPPYPVFLVVQMVLMALSVLVGIGLAFRVRVAVPLFYFLNAIELVSVNLVAVSFWTRASHFNENAFYKLPDYLTAFTISAGYVWAVWKGTRSPSIRLK
ncbi:MAG TPA: hypothetical protein VL404_05515 [Candidatus Eisenbacteria bacterium]|jgi:hypothetical protein|nr:hypothetical protein [Candidatus Eisenbacteria bacterium]